MENEKIQQIQFLEQNIQGILMQKQSFQMEMNETISALKEIEKSKEDVYKVIGQIMIKLPREKIVEDLKNKEKILKVRIESLENQENSLNKQLNEIKEEVLSSINKKEKSL